MGSYFQDQLRRYPSSRVAIPGGLGPDPSTARWIRSGSIEETHPVRRSLR